MRCPGCNGVFRVFVHGNGAVELRPVDDEPATDSPLPPRSAEQEKTKETRTIFTSRRRNRPIGGYLPFEKSRSYIGTFAFWTALGLGSLTAYWYFNHIETISNQMGKRGNNAMAEGPGGGPLESVPGTAEAAPGEAQEATDDGPAGRGQGRGWTAARRSNS